MKFFIDTANLDEIREAAAWGICDGVTTNPTLISRESGRDFRELVTEITGIIKGPVSVEAVSRDAGGMIKEARDLSTWAGNVVIKIPMTSEGVRAAKQLSSEGIRINMTLVFSASQALLAAKAGAAYVSPFVGRLDDTGHDGMQVVRDILEVYRNYGFGTEVIVASVRHPMHVIEAAKAGAHISTIPFGVLRQMFRHPLTDTGIERFLKDWEKVNSGP